jgi:hypothetical protein
MPAVVFPTAGVANQETVKDLGGPVIGSAQVELVFWGPGWTTATNAALETSYRTAVSALVSSPYLSALSQYRSNLGSANLAGSVTVTSSSPPTTFTDSDAFTMLTQQLQGGTLPSPVNNNHLFYWVVPQPGTNTLPSELGDHSFGAWSGTKVHFGITTNPVGTPLDELTLVFGHELVEGTSDPELTGIQTSPDGELADGGEFNGIRLYNGVVVQSYWSRADNAWIVPTQTTTVSTGTQSVVLDSRGILNINGDQHTNKNDIIVLSTGASGQLVVTLNGETAQFDPLEVAGISVTGGTGDDSITVKPLPISLERNLSNIDGGITIDGGIGNDAITVDAGLSGLGLVTATGGAGIDSLTVDGSQNGPTNYLITPTVLAGVSNSGFENLSLIGGSGADRIQVQGTTAGSTLTINGGTGNDRISIQPLSAILGAVTVNGGGDGGDSLILDDSSNANHNAFTISSSSVAPLYTAPISYSGIASLGLYGGAGSVSYNVTSTAAGTGTTINTGAGADTVYASAGTLRGPLSVNGQANNVTLNVYQTYVLLPETFTITATSVGESDAARVSFTSVKTLNLTAGSVNDTIDVASTAAGSVTNIDAGAGYDTIVIGSATATLDGIQGAVNVTCDDGEDTLSIVDYGDTRNETYSITGSSVSRGGEAPIGYAGLRMLGFTSSSGVDTINVTGTTSITSIVANGTLQVPSQFSTGHFDTVNVGSGGSVQSIRGPLTVSDGVDYAILNIDDSADPASRTVVLSDLSISGLAPAAITYVRVGSLSVKGGSGGNSFTIANTPGTTSNNPVAVTTSLDSGSGVDTVNVQATTGRLNLTTSGGRDTVNVGLGGSVQGILGAVSVTNPPSYTALTVDDSADAIARAAILNTGSLTGLAPAAINFQQYDLSSLTVKGGNGGNTFTVAGVPSDGFMTTTIASGGGNDTVKLLATASGPLSLNGQGGNDTLDYSAFSAGVAVNLSIGAATAVSGGVTGFENAIGGSGDDYLVGNSSNNILIGGPGNDTLYGFGGRDLLIGGTGADALVGNAGDAILIGGSTTYGNNIQALEAILAEWSRNDETYAVRVSHITGAPGGVNGSNVLTGTTLIDDAAIDALYGTDGADLFFLGAQDHKILITY